eukprot:4905461-Pyramimonas_sp.AAC.1
MGKKTSASREHRSAHVLYNRANSNQTRPPPMLAGNQHRDREASFCHKKSLTRREDCYIAVSISSSQAAS